MILLDTNVISELSKPQPDPRVTAWLNEHEAQGMLTSALTVAELRTGLAAMPEGKRKTALVGLINELLNRFGRSPVAFDGLAADDYAAIVTARKKSGRPILVMDALIAAVAVSHGLTLATRDVADFSDIEGLKLIDPWEA